MSRRDILMILPQLPPAVCGVGDYTTRLLNEWGEPDRFRFVLLRGLQETLQLQPKLRAVTVTPSSGELLKVLRSNQDCDVWVQYIPFGLQRKGCPLWVIDALCKWRSEVGEASKLVVMFHELWSIQPWWKPQGLIQWLHKQGVSKLLKITDGVFTNTEGYAEWIKKLDADKEVTVVPVGSNFEPVADRQIEREKGLYVLFGRQGTRIHALREFGAELKKLHDLGRLKKLVMLGGGGGSEMLRTEEQILNGLLPSDAFEISGFKKAATLSDYLSRAEFAVSCQTWSSVTKSTTFMAYAAYGTNIVSPFAGKDSRVPFNWLTSVDEIADGGEEIEKAALQRSARLKAWYEANASWPMIAEKFRKVLDS